MRRYSTRDAAELLGLTPARVRGFVRAGYLQPERDARGQHRFSFQDFIVLRSAKELLDSGLSVRKVNAALTKLRADLPNGRPLTAVRVMSQGGRVVVRDSGRSWSLDSGQMQFDFDVAEMATQLAPVARRVSNEAHTEPDMDSDEWFNLALELEPVEVAEAERAYERAIALDHGNVEAHINLGRLLQERGDPRAAITHYRAALELDGRNALGAFNLGTAFEDLEQFADAISSYEKAVEIDARLGDAHFNLARLCERRGETEQALRHLRNYKALR